MVNERGPDHILHETPEVPLSIGGASPPRVLLRWPFLWLVLAELFANLGLWAFFLATASRATYRFGASPAQLGLLLAAYSLAFLLVAPAVSVAADRWSPKWILVLSYAASIAFIATALWAPSLPWLYLAMGLFGGAHAAVWPSRGALVPLLVEEERLVQANGMIGMTWQIPLVAGPAAAALLIRLWGEDAPLVFAAVVTAIAVALYLPVPDRRKRAVRQSVLADLGGGFTEGWTTPELRWLLSRSLVAWVAMGILITLEPLLIKELLRRGQEVFGLMLSLQGAGAFVASIVLARMRSGRGRERVLVACGLIGAGTANLLYVGTSSVLLAGTGAVLFGVAFTFYSSPAQALIQRVARNAGRVTGAYSMIGEGGPLASALVIAAVGGGVPVRGWLVAGALMLLAIGLTGVAALRRDRRRSVAAPGEMART